MRSVGTLLTPPPNPCPVCAGVTAGDASWAAHPPARPLPLGTFTPPYVTGDMSSWPALSQGGLQSPDRCVVVSGTFSPAEPSAAGTPKCGTAGGGDKRCRGDTSAQTPPDWEWWEAGASSKAREDEHRGLVWVPGARRTGVGVSWWGCPLLPPSLGHGCPAAPGECAGTQTGEGPAAATGSSHRTPRLCHPAMVPPLCHYKPPSQPPHGTITAV